MPYKSRQQKIFGCGINATNPGAECENFYDFIKEAGCYRIYNGATYGDFKSRTAKGGAYNDIANVNWKPVESLLPLQHYMFTKLF